MGDENNIQTVHLEPHEDGYRVKIGACEYEVSRVLSCGPGQFRIEFRNTANGATGNWPLRVYTAHDGPKRYVALDGLGTYTVHHADSVRSRRDIAQGEGSLEAGMPGQVRAVLTHEGDSVTRGQTLVVLEAMKMELRLQAPFAGRVRRILCQVGDVVERGRTLVEVEASDTP